MRLACENELTLRHGVDVHVHAEVAQILEERRFEERAAGGCLERGEVVDVLGRESRVLHEVGELGGAAHHAVGAPEGMVAVERGEAIELVELAALPQTLCHGELVEIREQRDIGGTGWIG